MCRTSPSRLSEDGGTDRVFSCSSPSPWHFSSSVARWKSSQLSSISRSSATTGGSRRSGAGVVSILMTTEPRETRSACPWPRGHHIELLLSDPGGAPVGVGWRDGTAAGVVDEVETTVRVTPHEDARERLLDLPCAMGLHPVVEPAQQAVVPDPGLPRRARRRRAACARMGNRVVDVHLSAPGIAVPAYPRRERHAVCRRDDAHRLAVSFR